MYDFDGTIYHGDSGKDFLIFSFFRYPFKVSLAIIKTFFKYLRYKSGHIPFEQVKETLFSFVKDIKDLPLFTSKFVKKHRHKVKSFYASKRLKSDFIITASLDFYVKPLCHELGIRKIYATKYDIKNGKIIGLNCKGEAKAKVVSRMFPKPFKNFYTDSKSDMALFPYALNNYIVEGEKLVKYDENYQFKTKLFDFEFLIFVFCGGLGTLTNFLVSSLISRMIDPVLAYFFGYSSSLVVTYLLNIRYIFLKKANFKDFIKFVISYIPNFIILFGAVYLFINNLHFNKYLVYLLVSFLALPLTYLILKVKTFKK